MTSLLPMHTQKASTLLREAMLDSTASRLHGLEIPVGSTVMSGQSIVLRNKMVGKVTGKVNLNVSETPESFLVL